MRQSLPALPVAAERNARVRPPVTRPPAKRPTSTALATREALTRLAAQSPSCTQSTGLAAQPRRPGVRTRIAAGQHPATEVTVNAQTRVITARCQVSKVG